MSRFIKTSFFVCLFLIIPCKAREITVDDDGPADFNNIQAAINDANEFDKIIVAEGTYNENIYFYGKNVILTSTDPNDPNVAAGTVIDGGGTTSVVTFVGSEDPNCKLTGFTITGGHAIRGAGINGLGTEASITHCVIANNLAKGIYLGKEVGFGGGLSDCQGYISDCVIIGNTAKLVGGGLDDCDGPISRCVIADNIAEGDPESLTLKYGWGGGLNDCNGPVINCTIANNSGMAGGGVFNMLAGSETTFVNVIVWGNTDDYGTGETSQINSGETPIIDYSCVQGWTGNWGGVGNFGSYPCFINPDANDYHLKSTSGRWNPISESWVTDTVTSPCIDAGNPGCPLRNEPVDANNVRINMGAYGGTAEASKSPVNWALLADLTNDHAVDVNDLDFFVDYWLDDGLCLPSDLSRNESVDFVDFDILADSWLLQ